MEKYIKLKEKRHGITHIETRVYYDLGGFNFFTGQSEARGYYLSVSPVEYSCENGHISVGFTAFTGYKYLLKEVARQSEKAAREAEKIAEKIAPQIIALVCKENDIETED